MAHAKFYVIGFCLLILFDTASQICFKMAAIHAEPFQLDGAWLVRLLVTPWAYGAGLGYLAAFVTWMTLLRYAPVGPAFAASHLEVVGVILVSVPLFGEVLRGEQWLGAGLVIAGVVCLARGEAEADAPR